MAEPLVMWTLYERPRDFPQGWIARRSRILPDLVLPDAQGYGFPCCIDCARKWLREKGLIPVPRSPDDDPSIVETWT